MWHLHCQTLRNHRDVHKKTIIFTQIFYNKSMKKFLTFCLLFVGLSSAFSQTAPEYVDLPECNKSEARMLRSGIITYIAQFPDSTKSTIFENLRIIDEFIKEKHGDEAKDSTVVISFKQIPMRVINFIENTYFDKDIYKWTPKIDRNTSMYEMNVRAMKSQQEQMDKYWEEIKNKISFQCKWFTMVGLPCNEY